MRAARACLVAAALLATAGCISDSQVRGAITDVNHEFRIDYERILARKGARTYPVQRSTVYAALRSALMRLGMRVEGESPDIGYINVAAPAPAPLDSAEWGKAADADLPRMREIASRHVGLASWLLRFEPEGLDIVINGATVARKGGTEVSLTMRMREVKPAKSGMPRREYAPPTAVDIGLDKIWTELERELRPAL
jgi:hypothetical protein